ncbi:DsbC family protein [Neisseria wadsworthii]|uniref:Thiol:disulfide interchange protein n=1 Tax=Neisseria wadsworthii 9715 TaxID=1030841 RepID=G4CTJ0_9NEIS|nr:DsbC family protein [Neisseria wadsworthii]EGZ44095.1 thiol:disulfide interchange protein [Neisseria wadsworthii 9715]QMT35974.1 DsbC family protein [Neisseria wadsworthii]
MNLSKTLISLALLPLMACGQPTENSSAQPAHKAASSPQKNTKVATKGNVPEATAKAISSKLEQTYGNQKLKVQSIQTTPMAGLFEVVVSGNQIIYTDAKADYMFVGDLIDLKSRKSLTEERMADISRVDFASLPLEMAIKEVRGNGKLKVAVFSDPDCPFCKRLEREFGQMTDITIYNFMMPIASLHPQAHQKSVQIWCQKDRTAAWTNWMRKGVMPDSVAECDNPITETTSLGEQLGFTGTPAVIFPNGKVQAGYSPKAQLEQALKNNQK